MRKVLFPILILFCAFSTQTTFAVDTLKARDSLTAMLTRKMSYEGRVELLLNLIDLSPSGSPSSLNFNKQLYALAASHRNVSLQLDAIRNLAAISPEKLPYYYRLAQSLPVSNKQKEVVSFLQYTYTLHSLSYKSPKENLIFLEYLIKQYKTEHYKDIYQQAGQLFCLCSILSQMTGGQLCVSYLKELGSLVEKLPSDACQILSNAYFVLAAQFYSHLGMQKEALAADRKILQQAAVLEKQFHAQGRKFKSMDIYRCISYRRMLMYSSVLSQQEIEQVFMQIKKLAQGNDEIKQDLYSPCSISMIRYYMSMHRYKEALPYINNVLTSHDKQYAWLRNECLRYRIMVGKTLPFDKDYKKYASAYISLLENMYKRDLDVKSKELQITYNVNNLIRRVADLEEQKEIEKQNRNEVINIISLISFIVIIVLLIVVLHYLYLYKRSNAHLLHVTKKLKVAYGRAEIADKMKTMFIRDMNHEFRTPLNAIVGFSSVLADDTNLTGSERKKLSAIIEDNSNLLLKQLSELLDVSLMESGAIQCNYAACSLNELCSTAVDDAINKCRRGVEMSYERHDNDETLVTDGRLVLQVLLGLLDNAAKFTNEGSIRLTYTVDKARGVAAFAVTDTGPGIPADKVDAIFERFEKLDQFKSGVGMGLNLCKLISDALHGSIWLDTSYVDGARFFFEVPSENIGLKK